MYDFLIEETEFSLAYENIVRNMEKGKNCGEYVEKHHVHPRSLGGNDNEENLVYLGKEHFDVHKLLFQHFDLIGIEPQRSKMAKAWHMMFIDSHNNREDKFDSEDWVKCRKANAEAQKMFANEIQENGKTRAKNWGEKAMSTMSKQLEDGTTILEKRSKTRHETMLSIDENGKSGYQRASEKTAKIVTTKKVNGVKMSRVRALNASKTKKKDVDENGLNTYERTNRESGKKRSLEGTQAKEKHPLAMKVKIYNENDVLVNEANGNLEDICKENGYPWRAFQISYRNGGERLYTKSTPNNKEYTKFTNWYVIKEKK